LLFNRPFDKQFQTNIRLETEAKIHIQQDILGGKYELVLSCVLDYENGLSPYLERKNRIILWKDIAIEMCYESDSVLADAESLEKIGVKMLDSLHIACAIFTNCNYFITTDSRLLKKPVNMIRIIDPIEFTKRECV